MEEIQNLVDEFIKFEKLLNQTSTASKMRGAKAPSPYYEIIKIYSSQTKQKIKTLLSSQNQKTFYDYMFHQKQKSKALKQNMPEHDFEIVFDKIPIEDTNDLKILFMISFKNAVNATFETSHNQLDLMILNNNKMIKKLSKMLLNPILTNETFDEIENLIYLLKIKIDLYKFIYSKI